MNKKEKIWKCFSKIETLKTVFFCSICELFFSQKTANFTCVVVLVLCGIMRRGASYLYRFSTNNFTGANFTWGSNIILFYLFYCWFFTPRFTLLFVGFVWMITTSSTPEGGQYRYNKNSLWSCTNSNTPSQQGRYSSVFISIMII